LMALEMNLMLGNLWGSFLLGGQWKVLSLVAFGIFHVWLPLKGKGQASFSFPSTLYPIKFYLNLSSIDFKVLFHHGSRPIICVFPSFSLTYKLQSCILRYQAFHIFIAKLILIKDLFFSLNSRRCAWLCFMGLKPHKWTNNHFGSHP
jgi:hypothetical protein